MLDTYTWPRYASPPAPELGRATPRRVPLVVVGAGPVGLTAAIDAAQRGLPVVLLDDDDTVSVGSRAVCHAKRTLEIFDRLGVGDAVVAKGVTWNVGRTFHGEREVFRFDLRSDEGQQRPGMVNLQQYHLEQLLVERAATLPGLELRWRHKVVAVAQDGERTTVEVESPAGHYRLQADWLIAADGARSPIRQMLGLDSQGRIFQDPFLIVDVVLDGEPDAAGRSERRFWFNPPFHPEHSALMHRQADRVWRIDFQLGCDADPELEKQPARVRPRVRALLDSLGLAAIGFELEWLSVYTFQCRRMARLRHARVLFAGDAAHQVSPFGARGGNSGIQDADNLIWKLDLVCRGLAPAALLDTYDLERGAAADENLRHSARATDFMTPKSHACEVLRAAVLGLAAELPLGRVLVNSGRLSVPTVLRDSPLNTPDGDAFEGWMEPGAPADDAPVRVDGRDGWLLRELGPGFLALCFGVPDGPARTALRGLAQGPLPVRALVVLPAGAPAPVDPDLRWLEDVAGLVARRFDARPGTTYLLRPDQHVAARWRRLDAQAVRAAAARASAQEPPP
jgi:3-(3-hydroxy-phenyl)propionate hydroxylase